MSKTEDKRVRNAALGLAGLVTVVIGVGVARGRSRKTASSGEVVEATAYRGARYQIARDGGDFEATIPVQTVGTHDFADERSSTHGSLELARAWVQRTVDAELGAPRVATFAGGRG